MGCDDAGDVLIRGARIVDGTGAPWRRGDLRISNGLIASVGTRLAVDGARIVEANDRFLAPGFIDAHCHDDLANLRHPSREEKILQGVTTVVVGNCSFSLYPVTDGSRGALAKHFGSLLGETRDDEVFEDFSRYRRALESRGAALNTVSLVGHSALRLAIVGLDRRPASADECRRMTSLLRRQLDQGAAGLSLGLVYPPSAWADAGELDALAACVSESGKLLTAHIRNYEGGLLDATQEFLSILRRAGCAGLLSHLQVAGRPNRGGVTRAIEALEAARDGGLDVTFDMYPYPAGSSYMLQLLPPDALDGGHARLVERLDDKRFRDSLQRWVEQGSDDVHSQSKVALIGWESVHLSAIGIEALKPLEGQSMAEAARIQGTTAFDLMLELIVRDAGQTGIVLFQLDEADVRAACSHRLHAACSDGLPREGGRPHPRGFGTFARFAGRQVREGWFPVEDAVRRMTSASAQRFGLVDRGVIRKGLVADLTLFDPDVEDRATFDDPVLLATGIDHVFVAGQCVVSEGQPTGRLPGRVLPLQER